MYAHYFYESWRIFFISDVDECASDPCHNEGNCTDFVNIYNCTCDIGWTGDVCNQGNVF